MRNPQCENVKREAARETQTILGSMSPKGKLGLPPLLERRRWEYGIPDAAFDIRAVFDRILVWQIATHQGETFVKGGAIIQPANFKEWDLRENPHGILISAGLNALDSLRSNGIDLGHHVTIIHVQPWRLELERDSGGTTKGLLMMQAGDITGSYDLEQALRKGRCQIATKANATGQRIHRLVDEKGEVWDPVTPWIADDM